MRSNIILAKLIRQVGYIIGFVSFLLYKVESEKMPIANKSASSKVLYVSPLVTLAPKDFLDIFSSEFDIEIRSRRE